MKLNIGSISVKGTVEEVKEFLRDDNVNRPEDDYDCQDEFVVVFKCCDGSVVQEGLTGDDAAYLDDVVQTFLKAYERSGFFNSLEIIIGNPILGDKSYKVEAKT